MSPNHAVPSLLPATLGLFRPPLATPLIAESFHQDLSEQLMQALLPLRDYCVAQEKRSSTR